MQDTEFINLWKSHDKQLQESLQLNMQNAIAITHLKVRTFLYSMQPVKIFTIIIGVLWVVFVDMIIVSAFNYASPFFLISAIIQVLLTKAALIIYLYQLVLIYQTDISEPIVKTQERLSLLQSSTLWVTRLLILQLPVWTTFYISGKMFADVNFALIAMQVIITGIFTIAAAWLFVNINISNKDKKWFRLLFEGKEWTPVMRSLDLLEQVKNFKNEDQH